MRSMYEVLIAVVLVAGCRKEELGAHVDCEVKTGDAIECDVRQTAGKAEMDVCWDLTATCPNGENAAAPRTCQKVKDGGTAKATIPIATMTNVENCQGGKPTMVLANLTIDGKKAQ